MFIYRLMASAIVAFLLTACVSPYQGFNNSSKKPLGYQEVLLTDTGRYHLSYHGDGSREQNYQHWQQRASELCPSGYKVIRHETDTFYGSLQSPVNGKDQKVCIIDS